MAAPKSTEDLRPNITVISTVNLMILFICGDLRKPLKNEVSRLWSGRRHKDSN